MQGKFFRFENREGWGYFFRVCPDCPFVDLAKRNLVSLKVDGMEVCPAHLFSLVQCKVYNEKKKRLGDLQKKAMELSESIYKDTKPIKITSEGTLEFADEAMPQVYYIDTAPQTKKFLFLEDKEKPIEKGNGEDEMSKIQEYLRETQETLSDEEEVDPRVKYLFIAGVICVLVMAILLLIGKV